MNINTGAPRVTGGQKVAENKKETEAKKPFTVAWNKTSATIGQIVGITGIANIVVQNPSQLTVNILFNGSYYAAADKFSLKDGQIVAEWKVKAVKAGTFTEGVYDAEIRYNNSLPGRTTVPLRIVAAVKGGDFFG